MYYKIFTVLIISLTLLAGKLNSQHPLAAYEIDGTWTFIDSEGEEMFSAEGILELGGYSEGFFGARIKIDGKVQWVFFNENGQVAITPGTQHGVNFSEGKAVVFNEIDPEEQIFEFGIVDSSGNMFKPVQYDDALGFNDGLAYVMNEKERGFIDHTGRMAIELDDGIVGYSFSEGLSAVSNRNYRVGYINTEGELVIDFKYDMPSRFSEGLTTAADSSTGKIGYINKVGVYEIRPIFDEGKLFMNDRTFVAMFTNDYEAEWALIDKDGKLLTDFRFQKAKTFSQGLGAVQFSGKWGFINKSGNFAFEKNFTFVDKYGEDGLAWAADSDKNQYGFIDKNGEYVIELPEADKYFDLRLNREVFKKLK